MISKSFPITHLIPQTPTGIPHSNSSLHAAGRYFAFATFWWYLKWPQEVQAQATQHLAGCKNPHLICISTLKYATQIVSMLGCYLHVHDLIPHPANPHLIFHLKCNNTQGKAWIKKGCTVSPIGHAVVHLQAALLFDNDVGYHFGHIDTKSNVIADRIFRILSKSSFINKFPHLFTGPEPYWHSVLPPNAAIISSITVALLQTGSTDPLVISRILFVTA